MRRYSEVFITIGRQSKHVQILTRWAAAVYVLSLSLSLVFIICHCYCLIFVCIGFAIESPLPLPALERGHNSQRSPMQIVMSQTTIQCELATSPCHLAMPCWVWQLICVCASVCVFQFLRVTGDSCESSTQPGLARQPIIDLYTRVLINVAHSFCPSPSLWLLLYIPLCLFLFLFLFLSLSDTLSISLQLPT